MSHVQAGVDVGDVLDELCGEPVLDYMGNGKVNSFSPPMGRQTHHSVSRTDVTSSPSAQDNPASKVARDHRTHCSQSEE